MLVLNFRYDPAATTCMTIQGHLRKDADQECLYLRGYNKILEDDDSS